jgi:hypothetical protein
MALVNRQNNLFAAEDWKVAYKAFSEVNFQAYDFDTIRSALVEYVRTNYPESFNDYIESSEFIAIIELLAYLSQSLTFRMDLNSRENFLETAERRDSVFKLARQLGYNPKRNIPASGLMKIVSVRTTEPLTDSIGNELNNINIFWDDANNPDSYEQFITVMNAAMNTANRFSTPVKSGTIAGIPTDIYEINTPPTAPVAYDFDLIVNGVDRKFQVVNPTFEDGKVFEELHPDRLNNFNLIYRNDSKGISSTDSGFFVMFKQGQLQLNDFNYTNSVQSRTQDIKALNINETDVYVQQIDSNGATIAKWSQIPNTVGQTLNYNDLAFGVRSLYSVENVNNAGIKLRFPDGNFGDIPTGLFRTYFRTSDPEAFVLSPEDARNVKVTIPYVNAIGTPFNLTVTFSLQNSVNNSLAPETLTAIKQRAPQVYYTQNRMVSAQDYNVFPFSQTTNIVKLKAINKTHAGHSRYIDISDPTGTYQNLETFANDGSLYMEDVPGTAGITVTPDNPVIDAVEYAIPLLFKNRNLNNFVYENYRDSWAKYDNNHFDLSTKNAIWKTLPAVTGKANTGYFTETTSDPGNVSIMTTEYQSGFEAFEPNNFIKFVDTTDVSKYKWARIVSVHDNGTLYSGLTTSTGPFALSAPIQDGYRAEEYIATMRKLLNADEKRLITAEMTNKRTFGLGYNATLSRWYVIQNKDLPINPGKTKWSANNANSVSGNNEDASWLLLFTYSAIDSTSYKYVVSMRGQQYVVQSKADLKFYNISNVKVADSANQASRDLVQFTELNYKPGTDESFAWLPAGNSTIANAWVSAETGSTYRPNSYKPEIALKTRSIKYYDVNIDYVTNGAIYRDGDATANLFVNHAEIILNPYFADGTEGTVTTANVTIANNTGQVNAIPANITIPFTNTTFGYNIINGSGQVVYKDLNTTTGQNEIYRASNTAGTFSYGPTNSAVTAYAGRILLTEVDLSAQTGTLVITGMFDNNYTYQIDASGTASNDKFVVKYKNSKEQLDASVDWNVVAPVKYNDGYTDNRKVIVSPIDTDGDLVPNKPLQFREFVNKDDLIFFEYYTDFDGYSYTRPITGRILDYRTASALTINFSTDTAKASGMVELDTVSTAKIMIVKTISLVPAVVQDPTAINNVSGLVVYDVTTDKMYQYTKNSVGTTASPIETADYYARNGRAAGQNTALIESDEIIMKWKHVAPKDVRIDPSVSNIIEMLVLTSNYKDEISQYKKVPGTSFPLAPTPAELATEFSALSEFKSASDSLVYKSAEYKLLFGADAQPEAQAKFRIVKLAGSTMSDNEIKSKVIAAFDTFFSVENWEFGETFYFTELSSYVHQRMGSNIGSIVIIPRNSAGSFGDLFQIKADPNELFLNTAKVNDIEIVEKISSQTLRADR